MVVESAVQKSDRVRAKKASREESGREAREGENIEKAPVRVRSQERKREKEIKERTDARESVIYFN